MIADLGFLMLVNITQIKNHISLIINQKSIQSNLQEKY